LKDGVLYGSNSRPLSCWGRGWTRLLVGKGEGGTKLTNATFFVYLLEDEDEEERTLWSSRFLHNIPLCSYTACTTISLVDSTPVDRILRGTKKALKLDEAPSQPGLTFTAIWNTPPP